MLKLFTAEVPKLRHMGNIGCGIGFLAGGGKAADTGEVLGAGTEISLLSAAMDERGKGKARPDVECADALGAVNLVAGDGNHIRAEGLGLEGDL